MTTIAQQLEALGMSGAAAQAKAQLYERCVHAIDAPQFAFFVPGRIEVLGKHTDYAGGRSLLCAAERGFVIVALPRADAIVHVTDAVTSETCNFPLVTNLSVPPGDWSDYVATVVRRVARNFPQARRGADIVFAGDVPRAAGMSSSSALVVAMYLALSAVNDLAHDELDSNESLAAYLAAIENGQSFGRLAGDRGVGTMGGSEDHTSILCCHAGYLSQYSFCPARFEREIPFPRGHALIVASSGVLAQKTGNALHSYNQAASAAHRVLEIWNGRTGRAHPSLGAAVASESAERIREELRAVGQSGNRALGEQLIDRLDQFVLESVDIIPRAGDALLAGQLDVFGELVDRSQHAAESLLRNQVPETITLARLARAQGAIAAAAFGAGFGGSVWALVPAHNAERFVCDWQSGYERAHPDSAQRAEFLVTLPGPASARLLV